MPGHSLTITRKEKQINKERKGSEIKINTNRKGEQSEVARGGVKMLAGCVSLVKSKWGCIIWPLHRIDPEHSPLHWAFLPAQIEGLPQEEVLWLGTIGIYPLLICGIEEANPWKKKLMQRARAVGWCLVEGGGKDKTQPRMDFSKFLLANGEKGRIKVGSEVMRWGGGRDVLWSSWQRMKRW